MHTADIEKNFLSKASSRAVSEGFRATTTPPAATLRSSRRADETTVLKDVQGRTSPGSHRRPSSGLRQKLLPPWATSLFALKNSAMTSFQQVNDRATNALRVGLPRAKVVVVGPPRSGRTTMAKSAIAVTSRGLLADLLFGPTSSLDGDNATSIEYTFHSIIQAEGGGTETCETEITVVDVGPTPAVNPSVYPHLMQVDVVVVTVDLRNVKKVGPQDSGMFHLASTDAAQITDILCTIASRTAAQVHPPPTILFVCTFLDSLLIPSMMTRCILSDMSTHFSNVLGLLNSKLCIKNSFAVSLTSGECVPLDPSGPQKIKHLWHVICDAASSRSCARTPTTSIHDTRSPSLRRVEGYNWMRACPLSMIPTVQEILLVADEKVGGYRSAILGALAAQAEDAVLRLVACLQKLSKEGEVVFVGLQRLWGLAFSFGVPSKDVFYATLRSMEWRQELTLFQCPPTTAGRASNSTQSCVLLKPALIPQASAVVYACMQCFQPSAAGEEGRGFPSGVDPVVCQSMDPDGNARFGLFNWPLLMHLGGCLQLGKAREGEDAGDILVTLLLLSDSAVELPRVFEPRRTIVAEPQPTRQTSTIFQWSRRDFSRSSSLEGVSNLSATSTPQMSHPYLYVPSMGPSIRCPQSLVQSVCDQVALVSATSPLQGSVWLLELHTCPVDFFPMLTCRLSAVMHPLSFFSDAVWLTLEPLPARQVRRRGRWRSLSTDLSDSIRALVTCVRRNQCCHLAFYVLGECSPLAIAVCEGDLIQNLHFLLEQRLPGVTTREVPPTSYSPAEGSARSLSGLDKAFEEFMNA